MKREIPQWLIWSVVGVIVVLVGFVGLRFADQSTLTQQDPDLAQKQSEVEFSRTPGKTQAVAPQNGAPQNSVPQGMTPGRGSEMDARQQHPGGN